MDKNYEIVEICCEKKKSEKCKGYTITILNDSSHYLQKYFNHTHASQTNSSNIAKNIADIKQQTLTTRNQPIQIIQITL
ncbi:7393_t:CDS:2 [Funneliformis geosporum]|uniref:7393_t:CDS:1 n=1 Tax=Funneliformis geosporum TaxID=1117311 RepID=A0A9W4T3R9_9GLOM|nr:7393_t:CDS:2 [Funneliformis geosporum]